MLTIAFKAGSVHLPNLGLWLDAHEPQAGPERVFVSHAHSDHTAPHREVILSAPTARLMQARIGGDPSKHVLEFGVLRRFEYQGASFSITLLPAGHIFGSAMSLIETEGKSLLYTGDFKMRRGLSAEPCEPRHADILIMESTFGRPRYVFPPADEVLRGVVRFCREALDNDETPVLLGYSLGKSQEIMCGLGDAGLPLMLHGAIYGLTRIYEQFGRCFPPYERYEAGSARGKVLLCPPNVVNSAMLRNLGPHRKAIVTGWAVDPNCRHRYQCEAAFPLSDHADFPELIGFVKQVQPRKVYTLHGFAADLAQSLRDLGYDAQALSQDEQFALALEAPARNAPAIPRSPLAAPGSEPAAVLEPGPEAFLEFSRTCQRICGDTRKLEKIRVLAEYLRSLKAEDAALAATWCSGRPFAGSENKVLQLGWAVIRDALCAAGGIDAFSLHQVYLKHSDLGETAMEVLQRFHRSGRLTLAQVNELFHKLHAARGPLAKTPLLKSALETCSALEGKYLVKIITGDLRIGLKEGLVEEAIASAFQQSPDEVRKANLLLGNIGETARLAAQNRLGDAGLEPFRPLKVMLASPIETAPEIWERMQRDGDGVWVEDKYDGIRCQVHKAGQRVALYSRDLKDVTESFFELADGIRRLGADFILDGEIVAMRGEAILPFAELQKRLGRRQGDLFMREEVPIKFVAFDLLWLNGANYLKRPLRDRRAALAEVCAGTDAMRLATLVAAHSADELEQAFAAARGRNNEGLIVKDPESIYSPGRRGLSWLKLKKAYATLDCVVIGAEYGHGKRSKVLSDYTFAVRDEQTGELRTIGKAYTGLTDVEIADLTGYFLKKAIRQHGRYFEVPPEIVLEIAFDRIQRSERHNSGLAMRFPRIVRIRTDKPVSEIDTLQTAARLAEKQAAK